jgi:2-C-methyl-D-erythritol 4-phosphate cytidylyltransferase
VSASTQRCWGVIPAAGIGTRMATQLPKQYLPLCGSTVLEHSLKALLGNPDIESVMVAVHPDDEMPATMACFSDERVQRTRGGATRSESVLAALTALMPTAAATDWVLVHDAARPCVSHSLIGELIDRVTRSDVGGILAEPVADTVKRASADGRVLQTLDRRNLWRAQTPQMFRLEELHRALNQARDDGSTVTDEASAMEMAGFPVQLVAGSAGNLKVTVPDDLPLAAWYLQARDGGDSV